MKKNRKLIWAIVFLAMLPVSVLAKEKVNVYVFKKEGCPHCANAITFFNGLDDEYQSYFNLVLKDVSVTENSQLIKKVANTFKISIKGVPFIVIGNKTFEGFKTDFEEDIKTAIKDAYENETPDVIAPLMFEKKTSSKNILWIILAIIIGILFLGIMAKEKEPKKEVSNKKTSKITKKKITKK